MNEKNRKSEIIITADCHINVGTIAMIVMGIAGVIISIVWAQNAFENGVSDNGTYFWWIYDMDFNSFYLGEFFNEYYGFLCLASIGGLILGIFLMCMFNRNSITISDQKVYGCTSFGKETSILIDQVVAVKLISFDGICVSTTSGKALFWNINEREMVVQKLMELLQKRQEEKNDICSSLSSADEIKRYKELLDAGIITQEEFDKKKNQLLNL